MIFRFLGAVLLGLICFQSTLFANNEVQVSVDSTDVEVGETFLVTVSFDPGVSAGDIEVSIPGVENFTLFSQSQQQRSQIINGDAQTQFQYTLQLRPQQEGVFVLGPVEINLGTETISDDEEITIEVGNNQIEQNLNLEENITEKPELQPLREYEFSKVFIGILACIFFIVFFILLKKYLDSKKQKVPVVPTALPLTQVEKLKQYFKRLEKDMGSLESPEYYKQLNIGIREIFEIENPDLTRTETLRELYQNTNISNHEIFGVFQKTYFGEFSGQETSLESKKEYIQVITQYLDSLGK
ncbi:BatD family protein [Candidatus Gracilibacteria bacterium]|nr:BatD family protein [Candidatus Gracilibacteria bacterium]